MNRIALALLGLMILTGCAASPRVTITDSEPEVEDALAVSCVEVSAGTLAGIQWGLDDRNGDGVFVASEAIAIKNPSSDLSWLVAARFSGQGIEVDGVWTTMTDPTTAPDTVAFNSVDAAAREFSSYVQPRDYSSALDGVDEVRDCLD